MDIVVIGGGNSAIEEAAFLSKTVNHITVVNILPTLQADAVAIDELNETGKADYLLGYEVVSFNGEDKLESVTVRNVETKEEQDIVVQGAFVFIGQVPETSFVKDLGITNKWGYIEADENMATKVPGIYAIGDVVDKELRQIITAANDGSVAAIQVGKYLGKSNKVW
jgi:thioredoxin reductase (NADPH)